MTRRTLFLAVICQLGLALLVLRPITPVAAVVGVNSLSVDDPSASESQSSVTFTVTLSPPAVDAVTVQYTTVDGSATAPLDYSSRSGTLTFSTGTATQTVVVPLVNDTAAEPNETFSLSLSNASNASIAKGQGAATIADDDRQLSISDASPNPVPEGDSGTTTATFTVTVAPIPSGPVSVDYSTANGTANSASDYNATSGTLNFLAGQASKPVTVEVRGDTTTEPDETFFVNLSNAVNASVLDGQGLATIDDNDAAAPGTPALSVSDTAVTEGDFGSTTATFSVTANPSSTQPIAVDFATSDGTARAGSDYTARTGSLVFAPGETLKTVAVTVAPDRTDEPDETFFLNLLNTTGGAVADGQGEATIVDNDDPVTVSVGDVGIVEGTGGPTPAPFTVSLSNPSGKTVTVDYATSDGSANAPGDYSATSGTLTFAPGQTTRTANVSVVGDALDENSETFSVALTAPSNATLADANGVATIADDDAAPTISVNDVSATEGSANAGFTLSLSAASAKPITVGFATADDTAHAPADYTAKTGTASFAPGSTTATVDVALQDDGLNESNEQFFLNLSSAANASIADGQGRGTITDNDPGPELTIDDVSTAEGAAATTKTFSFTVHLAPASGQQVTVAFATENDSATAPSDYIARSGSLTFAAGDTSKTIDVTVNGDGEAEATERFNVRLSGASNAAIGDDVAVGTILNDDGPPGELSIADTSVTEGNSGTAVAHFTVTRSTVTSQPATVAYATSDGSATAPDDYASKSGIVAFAPGETSKTIDVNVVGDTLDEVDETFRVNLSNPTNAVIADDGGTGTITDDDATPTVSIADALAQEGSAGTGSMTFAVTLSAASGRTVTANFATADGTATSPADFVARTGTVTFNPGTTSQPLVIQINGDTTDEIDEAFTIALAGPTNATLADPTAIGTILDDDGPPALSVGDTRVTEGNTGASPATALSFTVSLSAASGRTVSVAYATENGTAAAPADFSAASGTLNFDAGETSKTIAIQVVGDTADETNEAFTLRLSDPGNATLTNSTATGTIEDDDGPPSVTIDDVSLAEGDTGSKTATFTVRLLPASGLTATVDYAAAAGTATAGQDYTATNGTLTFAPGETTRTVDVVVQGDTIDEVNETFAVNLTNPSNAVVTDSAGLGTIVDDDGPQVSVSSLSVNEGDTGTTNAVFTVSLSAASVQAVTVAFSTANGSAGAPADYTGRSGSLTFAAGETTKAVTVEVAGDAIREEDETFFLDLANPTNATLGTGRGTATIIDNDTPSLSIDDASVVEGDADTTEARFTLRLTPAAGETVSVAYSTDNRTALGGSDYDPASGTITFGAGDTTRTLIITVRGDTAQEPNETFVVDLSNPAGATIADAQAAGTIVNDDGSPPPPPPPPPPVRGQGNGYWLVASDGGMFTFGDAKFFGSKGGSPLNQPIVGMASTPSGNGYWLVASDGGMFTFGDARFFGSKGGSPLNKPIVGMASTPSGEGYWLVASDGGMFTFGDARFFGSKGGSPLNKPIVGMASTPSGNGYWLVASDGGMFTFGDAKFFGSKGGSPLNQPIVGMASTPSGNGYWLVASDGGMFTFGDARFFGSKGGSPLNQPIVGMASTPSGEGYWLVASDGGMFTFGDAKFFGSKGGSPLNRPIVGMAANA